jgi:HEAT repeat protein
MNSATMSKLMNTHMERFRSFGDIDFEPRNLLEVRPDLRMLPVRHGSPIKLDARAAEDLQVFSRRLHYLVDHTVPRKEDGEHVKPERLREKMSKEVSPGHRPAWVRPEAVPALRQILMGEDKPLRWLLIELLAENPSSGASVALAQRAVFEFSTDLRQRAVEALQSRPRQDFRHILLYGLRYPWPPAADHAAEALVALGDQEAVPSLISYLKKPDPQQPFQTSQNHTLIHEVVRIHHQTNCLMCHSPAVTGWKDPVAGQVPGVFLTGTIEGGGGGYHPTQLPRPTAAPLLVRADIVFLRQDFSVPISTAPAGATLVADQRFDFLIRTRPIKPQELSEFKTQASASSYPQREAVLWALRELTGKDAGHMTEEWVRLFPRAEMEVETARLSAQLLQSRGTKLIQLLTKFKDHDGDAYTQALADAIPQMKGKNQDQARRVLAERMSRLEVPVLRDRLRDDDREIRRAAAKASALKASDDLIPDLFDLLEDSDPAVVEAAQSALQRLTGKDVAASE